MKKSIFIYVPVLLLFFSCENKPVTPSVTAACDYNGISRDELVAMIKTYTNAQLGHINTGLRTDINAANRNFPDAAPSQFEDSRTVFFKLDTLQQFFNAVKCRVAANELTTPKGTPIKPEDIGVRIYYTAYPGMMGEGRVNESTKKGHHTLVFVATYFDDAAGQNVDFDPSQFISSPATNSNVPLRFDTVSFQGGKKGYIALFTGPGETSDAGRNQGELCPPPRGCGTPLLQLADSVTTERR